jgi:hypothetical protein
LREQIAEARAHPEGLIIREAKDVPAGIERNALIPEPDDYLKVVDGSEFWTVKIPEVKWAVPGVLRAGLGVLMGAQKMGKSTLVTDMALSIATGGKFLGNFPTESGDVLYLNYEDGLDDLRNRARALGHAEASGGFPRLRIRFEAPKQDAGGMELIQEWAESHPERRLLIIDPFVKFRRHRLPSEKGLDAYQHDYAVVGEIHSLAVKYGFSILIVQHEKKADDSDWVFKSSGSVALTVAASSIIRLNRKRGQANAKLSITGRGVKEREYALKGDGLTWKYCGDAADYEASQLITSMRALLRQNGEMSVKELAETFEQKDDTIRRTLNRASVDRPQIPAIFYKSADGKRWGARGHEERQ